ncbi:MAG: transcriptional regulator [Actinobacteria bacterium]|nr:transcriptional regulator [Actinomycetota bacterium]
MRTQLSTALQLPTDEVGSALLDLNENQWFDRKSVLVSPPDLAKAQVAMANAEGGAVVIGLRDQQIEGIASYPEKVNALRQVAMDFTRPLVRIHAVEFPCINSRGEPDHVLIIEVEPSEVVHATARDEVYLRVGDETRRLTFAQRQELVYDKGQSVFDGTLVAGVDLDDLDWETIYTYAQAAGSADPERLLQHRGLLRNEEVTAAALLLFGKNPQLEFPNAYVRVLRHAGTIRETGSRQKLTADTSFDGVIDSVLQRASQRIRETQPTARQLQQSGRFGDVPLVPEGAWIEALVNAVIHRSYSIGGDHIRVEIFDDRIEVTNPGRFPGLAESTDPREAMRFARNPRVARVCTELGWAQELGEGIRRMFDEMHRAGLPSPAYHQSSGGVRVTLTTAAVDPEVATQLSPGWQDILAALGQAGRLRTGDVEELLGIARPTAIRRLRQLESFGLIRWVGASHTDPTAHWIQTDD